MRKYFLLSAVATLMTVTSANAENIGATGQFNVLSMVQTVDEINCSDPLILSIMLREEGGNVSATISPTGETSDITGNNVVYAFGTPAMCSISNSTFVNAENFDTMPMNYIRDEIVNGEMQNNPQPTTDFMVSDFTYLISDDGKSVSIGGTFNFNNISSSYYQATVLLLYTY
ncbi:MAG: hypothetical protein E7016_02920 [Alphaproteobacteria bacterium]|nr:hypothetical protein [Alphaproteobacteria bacterium]